VFFDGRISSGNFVMLSSSQRPIAETSATPPEVSSSVLRFPHKAVHRNIFAEAFKAAEQAGTTLDQYLIHQSQVDESLIYRLLARCIGCPFTEDRLPLRRGLDPALALDAEFAPVLGDESLPFYLSAPSGALFETLVHATAAGLPISFKDRIILTTPRNFRATIIDNCRERVVDHTSFNLMREWPHLSAYALPRHLCLLCVIFPIAVIIASMARVPLLWPLLTFLVSLFPSLPAMFLKTANILASTHWNDTTAPLLERDLPTYSVLVPLYREARIIPNLIRALEAIDYPRAKLEILILVETDDRETLSALKTVQCPSYIYIVDCPSGQPRTKPRALNIGLLRARGECVVVYDAEDEPDQLQLKAAAAKFIDDQFSVGCIQAKLAVRNGNESWITKAFAIEYAGLFDMILPGAAVLGQPIALGGTSNHFRRQLLIECLGWDAWNVTEDADLGLRLARLGYRTAVIDSTTWEEAPVTFRAWLHQRIRWQKGWLQTAFVVLTVWRGEDALALPLLKRVELTIAAIATPVAALCHPLLMLAATSLWSSMNAGSGMGSFGTLMWGSAGLIFFAGTVLSALILAKGAKNRKIKVSFWDFALAPLYSLMKSLAAWIAVFELIVAPSFWRKTEHGVSRQLG
jgi:cellulose synthase/poly-beta-1,6-N-acetylglucosamine synthase-like glycosyltransferase